MLSGLASIVFLLGACATSSGSAYSNSASSESTAARTNKPSQSEPSQETPSKPDNDSTHVFVWISHESALPKGRLILDNLESGASVYVDGALQWGTTLSLPIGSHQIKVSKFGYEDFEADIDIFTNTDTHLNVTQYPAAVKGGHFERGLHSGNIPDE